MNGSWPRVWAWCGSLALASCRSEPAPRAQAEAPATEAPATEAPAAEAKRDPEPRAEPPPPDEPRAGLAARVSEQVEAAKAEDDRGPTIEEALAAPEEVDAPKPPEAGRLPAPTEAELEAWNRKDPDAEERLRKWDEANLERMQGYFVDLQCFRHQMVTAGSSYVDGKSSETQWTDFKRVELQALDEWLKALFRDEPRIIEKSKFVGHFLEAHELVMRGYPVAYNGKDDVELRKQDAVWTIVEAKVRRYVESLGGTYASKSALDCARRKKKE